ncbi:MAG: hypothetical protein A4E55_01741 [Pelotomaculum sp. PtaU1.Bin035]|nr:MAG: hypothetical protein A4E55_01741 [Pelotomaculum sp. PtaU1.Bin035]
MHNKLRWSFTLFIGLVFIILVLAVNGARLYTDWLWFRSLNYQSVFMTIIISDLGLRVAASATFFILLFINLLLTRGPLIKASQKAAVFKEDNLLTIQTSPLNKLLTPRLLLATYTALSLTMAFLFSFTVAGDWVTLQKFLHPSSFGVLDPVFKRDIGFYVFQLPFYQFLYNIASWTILIIVFWVSVTYLLVSVTQGTPGKLLQTMSARYHLSFLAAFFFLLKAAGYQLDQFALLFTHNGAVWGPGYTAIHTTLIAYKVLTYVAIVCALAILVNLILRRFKLIVYSIGVLLLASVLLGGIYPIFVQRFVVTPNEISMETPYLEKNIQFTRKAYNLDSIEKRDFPAGKVLSLDDIQANKDTVNNIRLWDWEPLQQTYGQLQEMRLYYQLQDIDVDRYVVDSRYRQVMLAARELNQEHLATTAKTWVNQRLKYTHGYGIAMSPVNELSGEGLPAFFLKDIPPVTATDLKVTRPEIYYGEMTDNYVIVNTKTLEFDYPRGDDNVFSTYEGDSGVNLADFMRRVMFSFSLGDYKLLLAGDVDNSSRILYYRNIKQRVPKIAPFLEYDKDPYIVLSDGKLFWMWDAYTTTDRYPYSEPYNKENNYIRNAVKVVVDAYTGKVDFYISDPGDPLVVTYSKIFPGMFKSLDDMPGDLRRHIRYPVDLFDIQAKMYAVYHMEDPQIFYNKEDKWNLSTEISASEEKPMEPYYTIIKLPGEDKPEFVLILPFTPQNKKNMISWLAARSDGENYGKLLAYSFPKQELVYGPMQIEARINQDTTIAQQMTLWDQRGSRVKRGNLLAIPIKDALLYVEPLYLQAEQSKMPELRRVIVAHGDRVVMEPTLEKAMEKIFGTSEGPSKPAAQPESGTQTQLNSSVADLAQKANQLYDEAQNKLKAGDWSGYGETLSKLKQTLSELVQSAGQ